MPYLEIPKSLRWWFLIHFIIDMVFAVVLIFFTVPFFQYIDLSTENLLLGRLVGAALVGIGGISLIYKGSGREIYKVLLNLKLLWSGTAIVAIVISLSENSNLFIWMTLLIFTIFFAVWAYYKNRIQSQLKNS